MFVLKILRYLTAKELVMMLIGLGFIMMQVWLDLKLPDYMMKITVLTQTYGSKQSEIWANGGMMLLCALGSLAGALVTGFIVARVSASFSKRIRSKTYDAVDGFSMAEINKFSTSSLITRTSNDVMHVSGFISMGLVIMAKAPITAIWAVYKIYEKVHDRGIEWLMATGVASGAMIAMLATLIILVIPKFKKMQKLTDNINRVTRENLTGLPVVRAYNADKYQEAKFETANKELTHTQLFTQRGMAVMSPFMGLIMSGLALAVYVIGAVLINSAEALNMMAPIEGQTRIVLFANMTTFSAYAMQVVMSFMMIAMIFIFLPRASVSAKRINEVLDTPASIVDGTVGSANAPIDKKGEVSFYHVSFKYPNASDYVIQNITFTVKKGETVAFIGSTGSGKSTLINLIPRFYDCTEGEIMVDGVNVRDYELNVLRAKIGYVPQKAVMFSGTVKSNVAYGTAGENEERATDENIAKAVRIAQGTDFVEKMPETYNAEIARDGKNVSGGQKQRLAIARAIFRNPEIYIFDDSFSALDYKTDRLLRSALKKEIGGATVLIVAQRIGTIIDADKIVVLDEGSIVGIGTHKELLKSCPVYKEIALSQLSEEELKK